MTKICLFVNNFQKVELSCNLNSQIKKLKYFIDYLFPNAGNLWEMEIKAIFLYYDKIFCTS